VTLPIPAAALPRARTLAHPGPAAPVRLEHLHAAAARHVRLALAPGLSVRDAIVRPLHALGIRAASMTLLGGSLAQLHYCIAPADASGERVANYTRPIAAGASALVFGNATLGLGPRGEPLVHCHATFVRADGQVRGGHVVVDRSIVAAPIAVLATALDGIALRIVHDPETNMPLMRPFAAPAAAATSKEIAHAA
jgi:predicted DNA-binding protein with PD1-like motif